MGLIIKIALGVALAPVILFLGALLVGALGKLLASFAPELAPYKEPRPCGLFDFGMRQWSSAGKGVYWSPFGSWSDNTWWEDEPNPNSGTLKFWDWTEFEGGQVHSMLLWRKAGGYWEENPVHRKLREKMRTREHGGTDET